ncbi:hypothetical protein KEM56_001700 [Ascosphaera pollenicola]|nr:hypothetical protein KEM56_001700 [Ascosphaera pollenicola]
MEIHEKRLSHNGSEQEKRPERLIFITTDDHDYVIEQAIAEEALCRFTLITAKSSSQEARTARAPLNMVKVGWMGEGVNANRQKDSYGPSKQEPGQKILRLLMQEEITLAPPGLSKGVDSSLLRFVARRFIRIQLQRAGQSFLHETLYSDKSDVAYFEYMLTTRSVLNHLVALPDEFWFNCLRMAVSPAAQEYLQERLDATFDAADQSSRPDKNLDKFAVQFKAYLPTLSVQNDTRIFANNAARKDFEPSSASASGQKSTGRSNL